MLKDVLKAIDSGKVSRKEDLAALVDMDASAVDGMLDFLVKREYLKVSEAALPTCGSSCGHCGRHSSCAPGNKTYVVTEKGKRLAGNHVGQAP